MKETFFITNNTDGTYIKPNMSSNLMAKRIIIKSLYINSGFFTSNTSGLIGFKSKILSKKIIHGTNNNVDILFFIVPNNGTNHIYYPDLNLKLEVSQPNKFWNFDDFQLVNINGTPYDLTTDSVRFSMLIQFED